MTTISFSENHESKFVAFEDGKALASLGDPHGEALKWVYSLGAFPTKHVVVVGLGSGFHISALADLDPSLKITVVDSRESLVSVFKSQFPELKDRVHVLIASNNADLMSSQLFHEVIEDRAYVLSFRECWGMQAPLFSGFFAHLSGRSVDSVKTHLEDFGINMKALYLDSDKAKLLSIKDVLPVIEASTVAEQKKQLFRVLGELVK